MEASTHEAAAPGVSAPTNTAVLRGSSDWPLLAMVFLLGALGYIGIGVGVYALVAAYP
jgi:hypothetical protein